MMFVLQVEVLASLQRPKKITVTATDGNSYILLCKPKVEHVVYVHSCRMCVLDNRYLL